MSGHHKLSLLTALFININIMIGAGIFINTVNLAHLAGGLGFLSYIIIAVFIAPIMLCMAELIRYHPEGNFYIYGAKNISPFAGFLSAWTYFVGKLGSVAVLIHVFSSLIQTVIPALSRVNIFYIDALILALFSWLNTFNLKTGGRIMYFFFIMKVTPIAFAILSCLYLFHHWHLPPAPLLWAGIPTTLPLVLYAFLGFEAACALSKSIEDSHKNGPKAILYSFLFVVSITIAYQFLFFVSVPDQLRAAPNFLYAFPALLYRVFAHHQVLAGHITNILHLAISIAALGGSFGILLSNQWNLYALAQHKHTFFPSYLTRLNKHHIPVACIVTEAVICILYFLLTRGNQVALQQISVLGSVVAFSISIVALMQLQKGTVIALIQRILTMCAAFSCCILIASCVRNFMITGMQPLIGMSCIIAAGICMYLVTKTQTSHTVS